MHAKRMSRALLWGLICIAAGCSSKPPEEQPVASRTSQLVAVGWEGTGAMAEARKLHAGVLLPNGKVLVMGGSRGATHLTSTTLYAPTTGTWTTVAPMPEARQAHTATVLNTGKVLVTGGEGSGYLASTRVYDPVANTWSSAGNFGSGVARGYLTATLLPDGKVLVAGGLSNGAQKKVDMYDPALNTWTEKTALGTGRRSHTATLLASGKVLVVGGWSAGAITGAEVYDPAANSWSPTGALTTARYDHTATLLPDGKVLVVGGRNSAGVVASAELYDPATGTWSAANAPGTAREFHTATLLSTGKVLVAGGKNGSALASAEVYDPATGQWSTTPPMGGARTQHVAVALESLGKVLVVGGLGATGSSLATAELYAYDMCEGVSCNNSPGQCYEAAGTCSLGVCSYAPKASGASCDDGNTCTGSDACNGAGVCAGSATSCSNPPGQCYEAAGTCSGGACDYEYKAAGASCDDGDACTLSEVCNGAGGCAGTPVSCTTPPGQCYEAAGTCSGGTCSYAPKAAGSTCNDGSAGTLNDVCNGAGACAGVVACTTPPSACHDSPGTWANGACTYPFKSAGTLCNDADACTTGDMCNGAGACGGTVVACNSPPNSCYSATGACGNGTCSYTPEPAGVACAADSDPCTLDVCDGTGSCSHPLVPAGTSCGSGQICNATGQCLSGCWITGTYYAAGATNPSGDCQQCNPSVSTTTWSFKPATTECRASAGECDVAELCTGSSNTCPADGFRSSGTACTSDSNACTSDVCNGSGACTHPLAPAGTTCGTPSYGSWGSCGGFGDTCDETGSQSRQVTSYACTSSGTCAGSTSSESQSCTRGTTGTACNTTYSNCGSCTGFSNTCDEGGTQSCTVTNYTCSNGACNPSSSGSGTQACYRNTEGNECGYSNSCGSCGGFSNHCDTTGTRTCTEYTTYCSGGGCNDSNSSSYSESCSRSVNTDCQGPSYGAWSSCSNSCGSSSQSRTVTTYSFNCATGSCSASTHTETQACPGQPCPPPTVGSWGACGGFENACDTTGTQLRTVTSFYCSGGSCLASYSPEVQACTRSVSPPPCSGTTSGGWSACSGGNACGQGGTQTRTVTTSILDTASCQCVTSSTTETQACTGDTGYPYAVCNGVCTTIDDDPNNCGGCGNWCPWKFRTCYQGSCENCIDYPEACGQ